MSNFYKSEDCPSSQELLEFQNGDMPLEEGRFVREHLAACEFCSAEVEFYAHYPQADDEVETTDIPMPLFDLAESLLSSKRNKISSLDRLLDETDD
jgi:hypothetical protein